MRACFRSISNLNETYPLNEIVYRGRDGSLLEVFHQISPLKKRDGASWRTFLDACYGTAHGKFASGVWNKKELVLPDLDDQDIVSLGEGRTPLFEADCLNELFDQSYLAIKQCGTTHTGSFKDLGMTVLVSQLNSMIRQGGPIKGVACASTGDTSAALAAYAAKAKIQSLILLPKNKISLSQLIQPVSNGALVLAIDTDFDGCMEIVRELTKDRQIYLANSMNSLRIEGQKTVGMEVVQQRGWNPPDWFIIPGGNLGNVSALGSGLEMLYNLNIIDKLPRIVVAQAKKANPLYLSYLDNFQNMHPMQAKPTQASAIRIGNPVSYQKAVNTLLKFNGVVEQVSENELANAAALADLAGNFTDPHTGVALAALKKLKTVGKISKNDQVVVISTAHGLKFPDFKLGYHKGQLEEVQPELINSVIELPANLTDVKKAIDNSLKR